MNPRALRVSIVLALTLMLLPPFPLSDGSAAAEQPGDKPARAAEPEAVPDEVIVGFHPRVNEAARDAAIARRGGRSLRRLDSVNARLVRVPPGLARAAAIAEFAAEAEVRFAEPNFIYHHTALPNDPSFAGLWGLRNTGQTVKGVAGTPGVDIGAASAWDTTTGSRDVVVGVVDTGIDYTHPDLAANIWSAPAGWSLNGCGAGTHGYRADSGVTNCDPRDDQSHGTHVAGTIGATGNNSGGVVGVNWQVSLMGLKFLSASNGGSTADAITVLDYAVRAKRAGVNLRVLNNSWSGGGYSQALLDQINAVGAAGILFVAAAGNNGANNDVSPNYPASYSAPNIIAVAATNNRDGRASFTATGATTVHLGAPGVGILSTVPGAAYASYDGTSMAAPHVAGAAALVLAAPGLGDLAVAPVKQRLLQCGDPVASLDGVTLTGKRLNVARAIAGCPLPTYTLSLSAGPGGSTGASPPGPSYPAGTEVTLTATPAAGYGFKGWTIDGAPRNGPNPVTIGMYRDLTVVADFGLRPDNDNFPGETVGALPFRDTPDTALATSQPGEPNVPCSYGGAPTGKTVWYSFTPTAPTQLTISTADSDYDTQLAVYTGTGINALTAVPGACNDDIDPSGGIYQSRLTFSAAAGTTYRVQVGGWSRDSGNLVVDFAEGLEYYPLPSPVRLLDTRAGLAACDTPGAPLAAGGTRLEPAAIPCTGIPAGARAVVGNATAVNTLPGATSGHITLFPSGVAAPPTVANVNYGPGGVVNNAFTVGLGGDGAFKIYAGSQTHLVVDVTGYFAPPATAGLYFHPLPSPVRLLDTRAGLAACDTPGAPLAAGGTRLEPAAIPCTGIPAGARAVVGNATAVNTLPGATSGHITLFPSGVAAPPTVANVNYGPGGVVNNAFTVGLGGDGAFKIYAGSQTHLVVDVTGYYSDQPSDATGLGLLYNGLASPVRLLDTRAGLAACDTPGAPLAAGGTRLEPAAIPCTGIPAGARAVVGNATAVNTLPGATSGHITLFPSGVAAPPTVANVNYGPGAIVNTAFTVGLGGDGAFKIYAGSRTHLVVDVTGYFAP